MTVDFVESDARTAATYVTTGEHSSAAVTEGWVPWRSGLGATAQDVDAGVRRRLVGAVWGQVARSGSEAEFWQADQVAGLATHSFIRATNALVSADRHVRLVAPDQQSWQTPEPNTRADAQPDFEPWKVRAFKRLHELQQLPPDWDSYGGLPPTSHAVRAAIQLMSIIRQRFGRRPGEAAAPFNIAPLADGGIQLEWRGPFDAMEVWIGPSGTLGYLLIRGYRTDAPHYSEEEAAAWPDVVTLLDRVLSK